MPVIGNAITLGGGGGGGGPVIPSAYQRVEYVAIGSSGPYIDLGFVPLNHSVYADVMVVSYGGNVAIFGTESDNTYFHMTEYSNKWYWGTHGTERNSAVVTAATGCRYELEYNIGSSYEVYANSLLLGSGDQITTQAGNNLFIAKRKSRRGQDLRYYAFKVTDKSTGEVIRDLIPVYRKADDVVGFWDTVNEVFYTNDGTGSFTAGPDV